MALEYFTLAEAQALPDMDGFSSTQIDAAAAYVVGVIEREVGASFVARSRTETFDGGETAYTISPHARSLTSVTVDGTALTVGDLTINNGVLRYRAAGQRFGGTNDDVVVVYSDGYSTAAPADLKDAALWATRARLLETRSDGVMHDRTQSISNDVGGTTTFVMAGGDHPFGYPSVDAVVVGWRNKLKVFGFA